MAAPSHAHVKIGSYEFQLDESLDDHYVFTDAVQSQPQAVLGGSGKLDIDSDERMLWRISDWSGGEGARFFNPDDPSVYDYSEDTTHSDTTKSGGAANTRIRGQMTGRPSRSRSAAKTLTTSTKKLLLGVGDGQIWMGGSKEMWYGTDGVTWTAADTFAGQINGISAIGGDATRVFYAAGDGTNRALYMNDASGTQKDDIITSHASAYPWREKLMMHAGKLYGWTGYKLHEFDVGEYANGGTNLVLDARPGYRVAYAPGGANEVGTYDFYDSNTSADSWWTDCCVGDNSLFMMTGNPGYGKVYQFVEGAGRPFWSSPAGFSPRSLCFQAGVLFILGHWGSETGDSGTSGYGQIYAVPIATRQQILVASVRESQSTSLNLQVAAPSYGSQIIFGGANQGRVFVYDMETDGVSLLDNLPFTFIDDDNKMTALITYGGVRVAAIANPRASTASIFGTTTVGSFAWQDDQPGNREAVSVAKAEHLFTGWFDFNMPYDSKLLYGIHVSFEYESGTATGLIAGQTIDIAYTLDDGSPSQAVDAAYTGSLSISSGGAAQTVNQKGKVFCQISGITTQYKFNRMKLKITPGTTLSATQCPIITDVTVDARSLDSDAYWDLKLRVRNEGTGSRPSSRAYSAETIRDYLRTLKTTKAPVTFLDYYRYAKSVKESSSHTVSVQLVEDHIQRNGEGWMKVRLAKMRT